MKRKVGKELEGGIKKRNEVRNETPLASMFARQQVVSDLNKASEAYNAQLQKGCEGANSRICQCVEELQEEDAVKEQCRCNPTKQERTGQN